MSHRKAPRFVTSLTNRQCIDVCPREGDKPIYFVKLEYKYIVCVCVRVCVHACACVCVCVRTAPQWDTVIEEIKVSSSKTPELSKILSPHISQRV